LEHISKNNEVNIANGLFLRREIPFKITFEEKAKTYFQATVDELPETGKEINNWVSEKTKEKITELVDPGPIDDLTIAYLINAIYFKGGWDKEFNADKTTERKFYGAEEKDVEMMEVEEEYKALNREDLKAIKINYTDGNFSFYGFMPQNLEEFKNEFNGEYFKELKSKLNEKEIIFRMPKFTLEEKLNLNETLKNLGIRKAFESSEADFSKMVEETEENVYISKVLHSSFIKIDEKGTEAAAATSVEMKLESVAIEKEMIEFNKPFIFLIEENNTNTVLFIGQLVNP
jgi:serpin B